MKRKLISQGGGGYTIYLPKKWVDELRLKPGEEVEVTPKDKNLIISAKPGKVINSKTFDLETVNKNHIRSVIASAYKAGYDEIILNFKEQPKVHEINAIINTFTGLELFSQKKNSVTIKSFLTTRPEDVESLIVKMFQMINLITKTIQEEWSRIDIKNVDSTVLNIRKLRDHCLRTVHFHKYGGDKSYDYYDLVTQLEKIATSFVHFGHYVHRNRPKRCVLFKQQAARFKEFYECYLKKEFSKSNALWAKHNREIKNTLHSENINKLMRKYPAFLVYHYSITHQFKHIASRIMALSS